MASSEIWSTIAAERGALASDLQGLPDEQWDKPSWCEEWSVRDVVAHMTATARITAAGFLPKLIASGFSLNRMQRKDIAALRGSSPADTLANFQSVMNSTKHPPGPQDSWLGETLIHAEDIRRPLGIRHDYPLDSAVRVAEFYKNSNLIIGAKRRISGLRLEATDTEWRHGDGPEVTGPIVSLMLAMTGRKQALDDLEGEGVATLRQRT